MTLDDVKLYLRIDTEEEDTELQQLINASIGYIESTTGKKYNDSYPLMGQLSLLLISHWYTNRNMANKSSMIAEYPHSITDMLTTIKYNATYKEVTP